MCCGRIRLHPSTVAACWVAGAFVLMGISAWYVLRGRHAHVTRFALRLSVVVAFLGAGGMFATGDLNAHSSDTTLIVMLVVALIGMPIVLAYSGFVYWKFKGKVRLDEASY